MIKLCFAIMLSLAVVWQFAAFHVFRMPQGTFTNIHQLASFCILAIPILFFFFWVTQRWYRYLFVGIGIMALDLVLRISSRPAFLGIFLGALLVVLFQVRGRYKWLGVASIILAVTAVYVTNYAGIADRLKHLFATLPKEERLYMWSKAWDKIMENDFLHWVFGNGIGYFEVPLPQPVAGIRAVSPHNFFLDLLYLNGIIGFILVFWGLSHLIGLAIRAARKNQNKNIRILANCLVVNFISWLFLCGLNFPLYSKYSLFPLALILAPMFVVIQHGSDNTAC